MPDQVSESAIIPPDLNLPFVPIFEWLGVGEPAPSQWQAIAHLPVIILVGVTAAGKNTATAAMQGAGLEFVLLPNRRELSDRITIPLMMGVNQINQAEQASVLSVEQCEIKKLDRIERLQYTRQFRQKYPGGMAQVIAKMSIDTSLVSSRIVFDGLRGAAEVGYAATNLRQARFIVLEAPDQVRLMRLLTRNDPFDRASTITRASAHQDQDADNQTSQPATNIDFKPHSDSRIATSDRQNLPSNFESLGVPDAAQIFAPEQEQHIFQLLDDGQIEVNQLRDKLKIIVAERQNYDPQAARDTLMAIAPERSLFINTATTPPDRIAELVSNYFNQN
jgi:hypothetical protein